MSVVAVHAPAATMTTRGWAAFGAVCLLWGLPYLLIKVAVEDGVPPIFLSWARVMLGTGILALWAWRAGNLRGLRGHVRWVALFTIAELVIPFPLIAAAERTVDSSVAAILIASAPIFVAILAHRFDQSERVDRRRFLGLVVGLVGVAAFVGLEFAGRPTELLGVMAVLGAALGYAIGPMIIRARLNEVDPTATMAGALAIASAVLLPFALVEMPAASPSTEAIASIVVLGLLCTGAALAIYGALVLMAGAGRALLVTYINPLVATALGVVILGERPGSGTVIGLVLILAGSWLASRDSRPGRARHARVLGVVIAQGEVWWADLADRVGSEPGYRRPVVVVQGDAFNASSLRTVVCVVLTSNTRWAEAPGNVLLTARGTGLPRPSVANVSQLMTLDREALTERAGRLSRSSLELVLTGIDVVLGRS